MNQSRSEYGGAITWREKQISTLPCDRIHDDYIAAIPSKKRNKLPQICGLPGGDSTDTILANLPCLMSLHAFS